MFNPKDIIATVPMENGGGMIDVYPKNFHNGDFSKYHNSHHIMTLDESIEYLKKSGKQMVYLADEGEMSDYLINQGMIVCPC